MEVVSQVKLLPHDHDVERAYLASLLYDPTKVGKEIAQAKPFLFHTPENKIIFGAMQSLVGQGVVCDAASICAQITKAGANWEGMGEYVLTLSVEMPTGANLKHYEGILLELAKRRKLIYDSVNLTTLAYDMAKPLDETLALLQRSALDVSDLEEGSTFDSKALVGRFATGVAMAAKRKGKLTGLATNLPDWDEKTNGLQPGHLIYIAGRPAMGKTGCASGVAFKVATGRAGKVIFFSLEMTADQLIDRLICSLALVSHRAKSGGNLTMAEHQRLNRAMSMVYNSNLMVIDKPSITVSEMSAVVMNEMQRGKVALVVVDYLQYLGWDGDSKADNRIKVGSNSTRLKVMARTLKIPVICLAQLNRNVEKRDDRRPELSDLAESGQIEMDADSVTFLFRPAYYNKSEEDKKDPKLPEEVQLIVAKNRFGETGTVKASFIPAFVRFESRVREDLFDG
jgi:replicative DNA helicase